MKGLIRPYRNHWPRIADTAFIAETATVIGDVEIGADANLWFNVLVRGDVNRIRIGARTNVQDGTVVHCTGPNAEAPDGFATVIGEDVTIGHMCVIHGCTLEDRCMIGIMACVLDGAVVESGALVGAGALVTPGKRVKSGELWGGSPARKLRDLAPADRAMIERIPKGYVARGAEYRTMPRTGLERD